MVAALLVAVILLLPAGAAAAPEPGCGGGKVRVATGCVSRATAGARLAAMIRKQMPALGLKATILRVDTGARPLISKGFGESMAGVPASPRMYFRIGSMAIPHLITLLLQLEDEGRLSLDDKLSKFRPTVPHADQVTLRMMAANTSGYEDWVQRNPAFVELLYANPFRQWSSNELLAYALSRPLACEPGTCFSYAHTNYALLSQVVSEVTGKSVSALMRERILVPLGLRHTSISRFPAFPGPALHSYTSERGFYEDATFWSPSWTIGDGTVMSGTIGDVVRTARAVGSGELISAQAQRERVAPLTVDYAPFNQQTYFGLGIAVDRGWRVQNPMLNGYTGIMAYLPSREISIGLVTTQLQRAEIGVHYATKLFRELTEYLTPEHVSGLPE